MLQTQRTEVSCPSRMGQAEAALLGHWQPRRAQQRIPLAWSPPLEDAGVPGVTATGSRSDPCFGCPQPGPTTHSALAARQRRQRDAKIAWQFLAASTRSKKAVVLFCRSVTPPATVGLRLCCSTTTGDTLSRGTMGPLLWLCPPPPCWHRTETFQPPLAAPREGFCPATQGGHVCAPHATVPTAVGWHWGQKPRTLPCCHHSLSPEV